MDSSLRSQYEELIQDRRLDFVGDDVLPVYPDTYVYVPTSTSYGTVRIESYEYTNEAENGELEQRTSRNK